MFRFSSRSSRIRGVTMSLVVIVAMPMVRVVLKCQVSTREIVGVVGVAGGGSLVPEEARRHLRIAWKVVAVWWIGEQNAVTSGDYAALELVEGLGRQLVVRRSRWCWSGGRRVAGGLLTVAQSGDHQSSYLPGLIINIHCKWLFFVKIILWPY